MRNQPRKKPISEIDPELLVKKATKTIKAVYISKRNYSQLKLHKSLLLNLKEKGYENPTEIQDKCIDYLISGKSLVGVASTGTGKTGAFLIPIIQRIFVDKNLTALVVVPTRELAMQVVNEFQSLVKGTSLKSACFIGGRKIERDISIAKSEINLVVGTPGRLNDLIHQKALKLTNTDILVLDEFDKMLDMGFIADIKKILSVMKNRSQSMLFSATVEPSQEKMIRQIVEKHIRINVSDGVKSSDSVHQNIIRVSENENKFNLLLDLIKNDAFNKVILFAETKYKANKLNMKLIKSGIKSDVIHGNKSQNYRAKAIESFKKGNIKILVATDVVARGIDIEGVTHVINYQLPQKMDSYIHRIGRTGRANTTGVAYTFIDD